jgi:hypothetical protein
MLRALIIPGCTYALLRIGDKQSLLQFRSEYHEAFSCIESSQCSTEHRIRSLGATVTR